MPICMAVKGGRSCPVVLCDVCMEVIADATDGNYEWIPRSHEQEQIPVPVSFTHKRCSLKFEQGAERQYGKDISVCNMELMYFPIYLGNNLELNWERAKRFAQDMSSL